MRIVDGWIARLSGKRIGTGQSVSLAWLRQQERNDGRISHGAEWRYGPVGRPHADHGAMNRRLAGERAR